MKAVYDVFNKAKAKVSKVPDTPKPDPPKRSYVRSVKEEDVSSMPEVVEARADKGELSARPNRSKLIGEIEEQKRSFPIRGWWKKDKRIKRSLFLGRVDRQLLALKSKERKWMKRKVDYLAMRTADICMNALDAQIAELDEFEGDSEPRSHKKLLSKPENADAESDEEPTPKRSRKCENAKRKADPDETLDSKHADKPKAEEKKPDASDDSDSSSDSDSDDGDHLRKNKKARKMKIPSRLKEDDFT